MTIVFGREAKREPALRSPDATANKRPVMPVEVSHVIIPYFDTTDLCPTCQHGYRVFSENGIAYESCRCGVKAVIRRAAPPEGPARDGLTRKILHDLHRGIMAPAPTQKCWHCTTRFEVREYNYSKRLCPACTTQWATTRSRYTCAVCHQPARKPDGHATCRRQDARHRQRQQAAQRKMYWKNEYMKRGLGL